MIADAEVKYGYTLNDLNQMTHAAMAVDRSLAMDYADRRDIAWSAIAEALCAAPHWPKRSTLIQAGFQAIYAAIREEQRQHGYAGRSWESGYGSDRRFIKYWAIRFTPSPEGRIVEQLAARQVLDTLTPALRAAVVQLATHQDYDRAAAALGVRYVTFAVRVGRARRQMLSAWFEGETPPQVSTADRRVKERGKTPATHCGNGHEWTPETTRTRGKVVNGKLRQRRDCRICDSERHAAKAAASREGTGVAFAALRSPTGGGARPKPESVAGSTPAGGTQRPPSTTTSDGTSLADGAGTDKTYMTAPPTSQPRGSTFSSRSVPHDH